MNETYTQVLFVSNVVKTFFVQKPRLTQLIPFQSAPESSQPSTQEYQWEQSPHQILNILVHQYIEATIHETLFQSLLAEQAARFISMDASTRNAKKLLEITTIQYNKFRQTKITREISELASSVS
jgi:F-type H+-transporting ATPase subunit gamma